MQKDYFDDYLKLMRAYVKTLRLSFNSHADWARLDTLPRDYHVRAMQVRSLISKEYQTLPDSKWKEKIKYYKQGQDNFDADHKQEGSDYCQYFIKKHREALDEYYSANEQIVDIINDNQRKADLDQFWEIKATKEYYEKQYKQNQSYMDALIRTRKQIDRWVETTLSSEEQKIMKPKKIESNPPKIKDEEVVNPHCISIVAGAREDLYNALRAYVEKKDYKALSDLIINNKAPASKIVVDCLVKQFAATFGKVGAIPSQGAKLLGGQIFNYFVINNGKEVVKFNLEYLIKLLRKGNRGKKT